MKKAICVILILVMVSGVLCGCASSGKPTLNVLNWGEYLDPTLITRFEEETGIKLNYQTCTDNETMYATISTSGSKTDVVFPSEYMVQKMYKEGLLSEIDYDAIPNAGNLLPIFSELSLNTNEDYAVPYTWGTLGILYNKNKVDAEDVKSWSCLWDEKYTDEIYMYDSMRDSIAVAQLYLGIDINSTDKAEVERAGEALIEQKPLVKAYGADDIRVSMLSGSGALGVVYSGDGTRAMLESDELVYAIPEEGSNVWFDYVAVCENSQNKEAAFTFINWLLDVEIATVNADYIGYSSPVSGVLENLDPAYAELLSFNPPAQILTKCTTFNDLAEAEAIYGDVWLSVKSK